MVATSPARLRLVQATSACLCVLLLGGCASVQQPAIQIALPDTPVAWMGSSAQLLAAVPLAPLAQPAPDWWQGFDDPVLVTLVSRAQQTNTRLQSAQGALQQARALRKVAQAALWPTVGSSASAQASSTGDRAASETYKLDLSAAFVPDVTRMNHYADSAADATARASVATLADARVQVASEVALAYITLRLGQRRLALADTNLANLLETRQIAVWRLKAGLVTELDSNQAETAAQQARAARSPLQTAVQQSRYALAVLTGQTPDALLTMLAPDGAVPARMDDPALPLPAATLRQRPDVLAAAEAVQAARARLAQAQAAQGPGFKLGSSVGLQSLTLASLADPVSLVRTVLGTASFTLWDGGAGAAQVESQQAALVQAELAHRALALSVFQDVEDLLVALTGQRERLLALTMAGNTARIAAALASQRYNSGLVDYQVVLETQRTWLSTQDSEAAGLADVGATQVRLFTALGGGWRADSNALDTLAAAAALPASTPTTP